MKINKIKLIYFSPTGTTQKVLESIAEGIKVENVENINLTLKENTNQSITSLSNELVIIGVPVYGGRLPVDAINRFKQLKANKSLAIIIVVYGNREFDDALLELKNLTIDLGLIPLVGGAFIGEHSFATTEFPIANGRPDSQDIQKAIDLGRKIKDKLTEIESPDDHKELEIPGRFPYESKLKSMPFAPVTKDDICLTCGTCAKVCPNEAISINGRVTTIMERCICCCACIKNCPSGARLWEDSMIKDITKRLNKNCSTRKEPQIYGMSI